MGSRLLPAPCPGWDDYLRDHLLAAIVNKAPQKIYFLNAGAMPSKIVKKVNEMPRPEFVTHIQVDGQDKEGEETDFQSGFVLEAPSNIAWNAEPPEKPILKSHNLAPRKLEWHADDELVKVIIGGDCPTTISEIKETLNELPKEIRERYNKRLALSYDANDQYIKLTDIEMAKKLGCTDRTLRGDDKEFNRIYNEKLKDRPDPTPTSRVQRIPFYLAKTDRTLPAFCSRCR
jgi:hypothetical protein